MGSLLAHSSEVAAVGPCLSIHILGSDAGSGSTGVSAHCIEPFVFCKLGIRFATAGDGPDGGWHREREEVGRS